MTNQVNDAQSENTGTLAAATDKVRETAGAAASAVGDAGESLAGTIEQNPLAALLGGLALGAIAGALLPRSEREAELLGPIGERVAEAARNATGAAREAGLGVLDQGGINKDAARSQIDKLIETAAAAAREAGGAALKAVREGPR